MCIRIAVQLSRLHERGDALCMGNAIAVEVVGAWGDSRARAAEDIVARLPGRSCDMH